MRVKVFVLRDSVAHTIPADRFYGAINLDTAAQTCNVAFYGAANVQDTASIIAAANGLGTLQNSGTQTLAIQDGITLDERYLSFQASSAPTGNGIAIYYGVDVR